MPRPAGTRSRPLRKLVKSPNPLPMSNIKILHPEVPYDEESSAVWPYRETFFRREDQQLGETPDHFAQQLPEIWGCGLEFSMGAECPRSGGPGNRTPVGAAYCVTGTVALSDRVIIRQENLSSAPAP